MTSYIKKTRTRKKTYVYWIIAVIILIIGTPILCQWLMTIPPLFVYKNTTKNDWIGFAGGYFGALIGAAATVFVVRITIAHEKDMREKQREDDIKPKLFMNSSYIIDKKKVCSFTLDKDPVSIQELPSKGKPYYFGIELVNLGKGYAKEIRVKMSKNNDNSDTVAVESINYLDFGKPIIINFEMAVVPERIMKMLVRIKNENIYSWHFECEVTYFSVDETKYVENIPLELKCREENGDLIFDSILGVPNGVTVTKKKDRIISLIIKVPLLTRIKNAKKRRD